MRGTGSGALSAAELAGDGVRLEPGAAAGRQARQQAGRPAAGPARGARWGTPAVWAASGAVLFACFLRLSQTLPVNSDGAANILQASDLLHGNLLLHGWWVSDVSFYTTELPQYALIELAGRSGPGVVHVAAAMTYTLVTVLAALLAKGHATGTAGAARALVAAGIMLAPQLGMGVYVLLAAPDHVGTTVPVMLAWLILDRAAGRWQGRAAASLLLAWALVADPLVLVIGVAPLALAGAVRAYPALAARSLPWRELSLVAAAMAAVAAATAAEHSLRDLGAFTVWPLHGYFASSAVMPGHVWITVEAALLLFGADFFSLRLGAGAALALLHLAGAGMAAAGTAAALRSFFRRADLVAMLLSAGVVLSLAAFCFGTRVFGLRTAREIAAVLPFGAALAGRLLAGPLLGGRAAGRPGNGKRGEKRLAPALCLALAGYLGGLGWELAQPAAPPAGQPLAAWLAAHRLRNGLAGYWQAGITTVASRGTVLVRPVCFARGGFTPDEWESKSSWYSPSGQRASFLVTGPPSYCDSATSAQAARAFGRPARAYHVGPFHVLVWRRNLLGRLR